MMKTALFIVLSLSISVQTFAQTLLAQARPKDSKEWGYINATGAFVIDAQYRNCHAFSEGFAPIYDKKEKTFYFIKPDGSKLQTEVDQFRLKNIFGFGTKGFENGMVPVEVDRAWGYMNTEGAMVVKAKYDKAQEFNSGYGIAEKDGKFYIIGKNGSENEVVINGLEDVRRFSQGLAPYRLNGQWGFIKPDGSVAVNAQYRSVGYMSDGLAWVKNESGMVGFIDASGNQKIEFQFEAVKNFSEGLARVRKNGTWEFLTTNGEMIKSVSADTYGDFSNGLAYAKKDGIVGFIGKDGNWVIDPKFEKVRDFKNGYAAILKNDLWGFIDTQGNWVIEPTFDDVKDLEKIN